MAPKTSKNSGKSAKQGAKARSAAPPVRKSAAKKPTTNKKAAKPVARKVAKPAAGKASKPNASKAVAAKSAGKRPVASKSVSKPPAKHSAKPSVRKAAAARPVAKKPAPVKAQPKTKGKPGVKPKAARVRAPAQTAPAPTAPRHPQRPAAAVAASPKPAVAVPAPVANGASRVLSPVRTAPAAKRPFSRESVRVGESKHAQPTGARPVFPPEFLERQRERLQVKKLEILAMYQKDLKSGQESNDSPTEDLVDRANNAYTRELAFSISDSERELMHQIDLAIERLKTGSYGFCLHTGQQIGQARLEAIPWAKYSVEAQELLEKGLLSEA